jgi:hypothetical protein
MPKKEWRDPRKTRRRCWIKGCPQYGVWVVEADDYREGSHYEQRHANASHERHATASEVAAADNPIVTRRAS